ncbi:MAG: penicillin-binding protein 2, partial [Patescibacteria group bacterium]|nr:penicillin-binding protein 2 [Patescibacteria group bacterium]
MDSAQQNRIKIIGALVCLAALVIAARLYYVQVIEHDAYAATAERQYAGQDLSLFDRGTIYFSPQNGAPIPAATLASGYAIAIQPKSIIHPEDIINALSGLLPISEDALQTAVASGSPYSVVAHHVDEATAERVTKLDIAGLGDYKEQWRYYPAGQLASNVVGFVGYGSDGVTLSGQYGLEKYYNDVLSRSDSGGTSNVFAQIFSDLSDSALSGGGDQGDIITTIEPTVQEQLEQELATVMSTYQSTLAGGIIMDPTNGDIYAMGVNPTFDPNNYSKQKDVSVFSDPLVSGVYEMGSIVKPLVMAAALDTGIITPDTTYDDTGTVVVDGSKISNYDFRARGVVNMQQVLDQSLNVGMTFVAKTIGSDNVSKYIRAYGLGDQTGIDLPDEVSGQIGNLNSPRLLEHATAAFGQGIAMSPIETIRALSALANGGYLPHPHVVKEIDYDSGQVKDISYGPGPQVIKPSTSQTITNMLIGVVDTALLNGTVKLSHYTIASKTGTAQIADPVHGGYYS